MILIRWWLLGIALISCVVAGFVAGAAWTLEAAFDSGHRVALQQVRAEIREAARDGKPFFLSGSEVRLTPQVRTWEIAGAGADVRQRQ